ncbi:MAG: nucleoside triphosphate pyrophosphohydrolase [Clostridia bacterium]|nr:nucleoside triphosphate pyrophosphohydrolase [Clostridia bacterium]
MLTILGLGQVPEDLTYRAQQALKEAGRIILRTSQTPHASFLSTLGFSYESLDSLYEESEDYTELCEKIATFLTSLPEDAVYACPGSAGLADETVRAVVAACSEKRIPYTIIPGLSAADTAAALSGGASSIQLLSAHQVDQTMLNPRYTLVIQEIDDPFLASDVKLILQDTYPDEMTVYLNGVPIELADLDRQETYNETTTLLIPPQDLSSLTRFDIGHLMEVVKRLRDPLHGCPWDKVQTHESILKNLVEESYEVIQAVRDDDPYALCEELGDLLFQIASHIRMSEETGEMNLTDVVTGITKKMMERHEAIFSSRSVTDAREMTSLWDENKRASRGGQTRTDGMRSLPASFPSLLRADKVQSKAAMVGFDWDNPMPALGKVQEEADEVEKVLQNTDHASLEEEIGDLLFSCVNVARLSGISSELALQRACEKFIDRFSYIESKAAEENRSLSDMTLEEMDVYWEEAKKIAKKRDNA